MHNLILTRIDELERDIVQLSAKKSVRQTWDLSSNPLNIEIGADIECRLAHPDNTLVNKNSEEAEQFCTIFHKKLKGQTHENKKPEFDGTRIEFNPLHGQPREIIDRFTLFADTATQIAQDLNLKLRMGTGHWHVTVKQEQKNLLNVRGDHENFGHAVAMQILGDQLSVPALFVKPHRAENKILADSNGTTRYFRVGDTNDKQGSLCRNWNNYKDGSNKFEMRIAHLAPTVPVMMILSAIKEVLKSDFNSTVTNHPHLSLNMYSGKILLSEGNNSIIRGKHGYADFLEQTIQSNFFQSRLEGLKPVLIQSCVDSYRNFLTRPYKGLYTPDEKAVLRLELDRIDFRQKFSTWAQARENTITSQSTPAPVASTFFGCWNPAI